MPKSKPIIVNCFAYICYKDMHLSPPPKKDGEYAMFPIRITMTDDIVAEIKKKAIGKCLKTEKY